MDALQTLADKLPVSPPTAIALACTYVPASRSVLQVFVFIAQPAQSCLNAATVLAVIIGVRVVCVSCALQTACGCVDAWHVQRELRMRMARVAAQCVQIWFDHRPLCYFRCAATAEERPAQRHWRLAGHRELHQLRSEPRGVYSRLLREGVRLT